MASAHSLTAGCSSEELPGKNSRCTTSELIALRNAYDWSCPNPASRARTMAWARSDTWSLVRMFET